MNYILIDLFSVLVSESKKTKSTNAFRMRISWNREIVMRANRGPWLELLHLRASRPLPDPRRAVAAATHNILSIYADCDRIDVASMPLEALCLEKWEMVRYARFPFVGRTAAIIIRTVWARILVDAMAPDAHLAVVAGSHVELCTIKVIVVAKRRPVIHIERPGRTGRGVRTICTSDRRRLVVVDVVVPP